MRKRAQAAMEFLLTYGWAIVVVVVAISALAYFGVLNPENFLPNQCHLPTGFTCRDFSLTYYTQHIAFPAPGQDIPRNTLSFNIINNGGWKFDILGMTITGSTDIPTIPITEAENGKDFIVYKDRFEYQPGKVLNKGDKFNIEFTLQIKNQESGLIHFEKGTISGKVQ